MKKILLSLLLCLVLCTASVFAEELQAQYVEIPFESVKNLPVDYQQASLFGDGEEDVYETLEKRIVDALKNMENTVNIADLEIPSTQPQVMSVMTHFTDVVQNNPYYGFYVDINSNFSYLPIEGIIASFGINYKNYDKSEIAKMHADIDKATSEILNLLDEDMNDFQKVMTVHDYMVLNYEYDTAVIENPNAEVVRDITMILTKKGVCMGYSYAFKYVMNVLGIECGYAKSRIMNHEWNVVKIDGEWYHIDLTHDDPLYGGKYDMFAIVQHKMALLSSEAIDALGAVGYTLPDGVTANSKKYDNAPWKTNTGSVVTLKGITYYVEGNNLVDETGKIIYSDLARTPGRWNGFGSQNSVLLFSGLASYYGKLYFNTENAIYAYDPDSQNPVKILDAQGISGMYINGDTLYYGRYEVEDRKLVNFVKHGEIDVSYMRIDETLLKDISSIIVTGRLEEMTDKQKTAANVYIGDDENGVVKINIKDIIRMAQIIATKRK